MWTKVCGFKDSETAVAAVRAGVNAIGLNFFRKSVRYVEPEVAAEIASSVGGEAMKVGLFVNEPFESVVRIVEQVGLDAIQFHGDETPEEIVHAVKHFHDRGIIKAFNVDESGLAHVAKFLNECAALGFVPWACLLDAKVDGERGGTGHTAPWSLIADHYHEQWPDLILAGGLTMENVKEAVQTVQPWGIDVASGCEAVRGVKDVTLVQDFLKLSRTL